MDGRESWQALQTHLSSARRALDHGDRVRAVEEVNAALAIDPDFAAARALRDRVVGPDLQMPGDARQLDAARPGPAIVDFQAPRAGLAAARPLISAEGYARFEERARRRRIERRTQAAREAIANRRLRDAKSAIDEIAQLDPNAPEIAVLRNAVDAARRARAARPARWWRGSRLAAAAAFVTILLAASWLENSNSLLSYPMSIMTALVSTAQPAPLTATATIPADDPALVGTFGDAAEERPGIVGSEPPQPVAHSSPVKLTETTVTVTNLPSAAAPVAVPAANVTTPPPSVATAPLSNGSLSQIALAPPPSMPPAPAPSAPPAETAVAAAARIPDDVLVRRALQQYKSAYEALDARSAQAVWPVVNERALARAFDGLESQNLMFDSCDVKVNGDAAAATCRGTARYVAKVGSREPRTEPRVWNFMLRRRGAEWKIDSARAER